MKKTVVIPKVVIEWDPKKEEFVDIYIPEQKLQLVHSLLSVSKWEAKWKKPFMQGGKTHEEMIDYIRCMTINNNVDQRIYQYIPNSILKEILDYIDDPMTATWFSTEAEKELRLGKRTIITNEVIYYWMVELQIPFECEKWHLNRLITLIRVINEKRKDPKKMDKRSLMKRNKALNEARKAKYKTRG